VEARVLRLSRRVVRKVIRSEATEFHYERRQQPLPRIDPWRDQLDGLLLENEGKPARERLTLIRIFEELRALGYEGSYDAVGGQQGFQLRLIRGFLAEPCRPGLGREHHRHPVMQIGAIILARFSHRPGFPQGRSPDQKCSRHNNT
jgi:hypothetical protein